MKTLSQALARDAGKEPASAQPLDLEALAVAEAVDRAELEARGVPRDLSGATRSTWDTSIAKWPEILDLWPGGLVDDAGDHPAFLLLHGEVGCGKSHAAAWIMRRFAAVAMERVSAKNAAGEEIWERTVLSASWVDVPTAMKRVLAGIRSESETMDQKMDHRFCVLDDIGAEQETDFQDQVMSDWIRERYSCQGYTVGTTNLGPEALRKRFPRAASRLMSGPVLGLIGGDARRKEWIPAPGGRR